ncbi:MAG TPA: hypothetical protein VJV22_05405 [Acidobacteriaceae bacterium]|nr:hypothetical protein [Acidobacteriaceae bacterium]
MQPDSMNREQLAETQSQHDHAAERALEMRIAQALEQGPQVRIPEDFAARVAARVPANAVRLRSVRVRARRIGVSVAAACLMVLAVAMLALAPHTAHNVVYVALEWTLAAQFCLIAVWIANLRKT